MPRPLIDGHNNALRFQQLRLSRVDTNFGDFPFGRNEQMPLRTVDQAGLQNAAILTPFPADDANDFAGRLALHIGRRGGRCGLLVEHVAGIVLVVLENDFARSGPFVFGEEFEGDNVSVHGSIEAIATLH